MICKIEQNDSPVDIEWWNFAKKIDWIYRFVKSTRMYFISMKGICWFWNYPEEVSFSIFNSTLKLVRNSKPSNKNKTQKYQSENAFFTLSNV